MTKVWPLSILMKEVWPQSVNPSEGGVAAVHQSSEGGEVWPLSVYSSKLAFSFCISFWIFITLHIHLNLPLPFYPISSLSTLFHIGSYQNKIIITYVFKFLLWKMLLLQLADPGKNSHVKSAQEFGEAFFFFINAPKQIQIQTYQFNPQHLPCKEGRKWFLL